MYQCKRNCRCIFPQISIKNKSTSFQSLWNFLKKRTTNLSGLDLLELRFFPFEWSKNRNERKINTEISHIVQSHTFHWSIDFDHSHSTLTHFQVFMYTFFSLYRVVYKKYTLNHLLYKLTIWESLKFDLFMNSIECLLFDARARASLCVRVCLPFRSIRPYNYFIVVVVFVPPSMVLIISRLIIYLFIRNWVFCWFFGMIFLRGARASSMYIYVSRVTFHRMILFGFCCISRKNKTKSIHFIGKTLQSISGGKSKFFSQCVCPCVREIHFRCGFNFQENSVK